MEERLLRQIRVLRFFVLLLFLVTILLTVNLFHPLVSRQRVKLLEAERINIREANGILKAALSNSAGFNEGQRAEQSAVKFAGLMFYNQEGQEEGGLVYSGKEIPGGQDGDVTLTMDQFRQDQDVYLHHEEHKDAQSRRIEDGLTISSRPDWTNINEEYSIYGQMDSLSAEQRDELRLKSLQEGKISINSRLFFGVRRGVKDNVSYDDTGVFIKNRWGQTAIKLYVDYDNKPHFEVYDRLGRTVVYELKIPDAGTAKKH
jgi:hypothetical protein